MTITNYQKVRNMHKKYDLALDLPNPSDKIISNRIKIIEEEVNELKDAVNDKNKLKILDALADILYGTYGMAAEFGLNIDEAFDRVHTSNMTKDKPTDKSGKLVKGPNYIPVDLTDLV